MNKLRRIFAFLLVVVIVALVVLLLICGITGSKYFWGVLFLTFFVPFTLYVFMWFAKLLLDRQNSAMETADILSQNDSKEES